MLLRNVIMESEIVKVKKLISELKKMPQNIDVGVAMHDNSENEIAGDVFRVEEIIEDLDHEPAGYTKGKKWIVLRC